MTTKIEARPGTLEPLMDVSMIWRHVAPRGVTLEQVRRPDYFRNNIKQAGQSRQAGVHAFNRIEILAEDGSWEAELRVMSAADGLIHTRLLREFREPVKPGRKPNVPDGYTIEHIQDNGWRALDQNSQIIAQRLTTEDAALRAAYDHSKRAEQEA